MMRTANPFAFLVCISPRICGEGERNVDKMRLLSIGMRAGLLSLLVMGGALLGGCGGSNSGSTDSGTGTGPQMSSTRGADDEEDGGAPVGGSGGASMPMAGGGMPMAGGGMGMGAGSASGAAPATSTVKPTPVSIGKPRRDPFYVAWRRLPPPPNVFTEVQPIRVASAGIELPPPPNTEVREVPSRRVSGIVSGEGVFAILEGEGEPEVVKPGMRTRDGYTVVSINGDSVRLQKKEGNVILTQVVTLSDLPPSAMPAGGGMQPGGMRPGGGLQPGGFPRGGVPRGGGKGADDDI
jgi:hypothetical protein